MNIYKILEKLIAFKTVTGNFKENKIAIQWIKEQIKNLPVFIEEIESNKFQSLIITTQKTKKPVIWIAAHLDVVNGSGNVFEPKLKDNILYGRGAVDMKHAIACSIKLLQDLGSNLTKYNFGIIITTDEEIGGENGVKYFLEQGFSSNVCFLSDGGMNWVIEKSAKGILKLKIKSYGKTAHSSRPWLGDNAINNLTDFLTILRTKFVKELCSNSKHYHSTINIGVINGGKVANQIPDYAEAIIDIRFIKGDKEKIEKEIKAISNNFKNVELEKIMAVNNYSADINNKYLKIFSDIVYEKLGIKQEFLDSHGASDARFFTKKGIPVILIRPFGGDIHSEKEWINIDSLNKFYEILKEFVCKIAK